MRAGAQDAGQPQVVAGKLDNTTSAAIDLTATGASLCLHPSISWTALFAVRRRCSDCDCRRAQRRYRGHSP